MTDVARTCPACGRDNAAERELCGGCGSDLDGGGPLPHPLREEAPDPPDREPEPLRHARWLVPVLGTLVVVALVVLALTLAGLGPLASGPDVPDATFDAARYPREPTALTLSDIATRTTTSDADVEAPAAMADGDPTTAWRSEAGVVTGGEEPGETIDLVLSAPAWIDRIELRNGEHADAAAYERSDRLRRVRVAFDGGEAVLVDLLDLGLEPQEVDLPEPRLTTEVRIDVLETFPGDDDRVAVSEIGLAGWPAVAEDVAVAEERAR